MTRRRDGNDEETRGIRTQRNHASRITNHGELMSIITILGSGLMGTAVAWPLADNGHEVRLVGTHLDAEIIRSCLDSGYHPRLRRQLPGRVTPFYVEDLPKALDGADLSSPSSVQVCCSRCLAMAEPNDGSRIRSSSGSRGSGDISLVVRVPCSRGRSGNSPDNGRKGEHPRGKKRVHPEAFREYRCTVHEEKPLFHQLEPRVLCFYEVGPEFPA